MRSLIRLKIYMPINRFLNKRLQRSKLYNKNNISHMNKIKVRRLNISLITSTSNTSSSAMNNNRKCQHMHRIWKIVIEAQIIGLYNKKLKNHHNENKYRGRLCSRSKVISKI